MKYNAYLYDKFENSHILLKSRNARKHGHFKEFGRK